MRKYLSILVMLFGAYIPVWVVTGVQSMSASAASGERLQDVRSDAKRGEQSLPVLYAYTIVVKADTEDSDDRNAERADIDWLARGAYYRGRYGNTDVIVEGFRQA